LNIHFRTAKIADLETMVSLLARDKLGSQREDISRPLNSAYVDAFHAISDDVNNQLLVVELSNQVIGMMQLTFIPYLTHVGTWRCLIEGVRIDHSFRGQSIGEKMFLHAFEMAKEKGCKVVQLTSDKLRPDAIRFYEKLGFKATHEGFKLAL